MAGKTRRLPRAGGPREGEHGLAGRRRALAAMRSARARQELVLRSLPVAVYTADVPSDLDATWMSGSVVRLTGFPSDRFTCEPHFWEERLHPEDREAAVADYRAGLAEAGRASVDYRFRVADGSWRWFSDTAHVLDLRAGVASVIGTIVDVTEAKETELALRRSEAYYRGLVEGAHDAIVVFDPDTEVVLDANERACELYGRARDELLGSSLLAVSRDPEAGRRRVAETLERGTHHRFETAQLRADGSEMVLEISASTVEHRGRRAILSINRDVTDQRRMEGQLLRAQKLEAVGRLAGGVAHDFNNLLQAMVASVAALKRHVMEPGPARKALDGLENLARRGAGLTRQLLVFSSAHQPTREPVDLGQVVVETGSLLRSTLPDSVAVALEPAPSPLVVEANRGQIEQVLVNLVLNARDAMPGGGALAIRCRPGRGGEAVLEVADTGLGMTAEVQGRMFEPFFSTKPAEQGSGLGLFVVHGVVSAHRGRLEVDSRPGRGTTVRVLLPALAGIRPADRPAPRAPAEGGGERILLVEDNDATREALADVLASLGYTVRAAESAEAAAGGEEPCDLLLTDLSLPGRSGIEFARELRTRWPGLPVIVLSGFADEASRRSIAAVPGARFLAKPASIQALAEASREALDAAPVCPPV